MDLIFLGTAASEGYPNAFCGCQNCKRARALGGPSLRKRCALLVDGELLIDLGPDVMAAALQHGVSLAGLRYCLQTHEHADHLDPSHFGSRSPECGVTDAPRLQFYATRGAMARAAARLDGRLPAAGLLDPRFAERINLDPRVVEPGQTFAAGPYRVTAVPAAHDPSLLALLYAVGRDEHAFFYGTDTGPLPEATWATLRTAGWRFDIVVLDHTFGLGERAIGHLNAEQFREQVARMGEEGLLAPGARVFAHHLAHHSNPVHPELVELGARHGYEIAYDGLTVTV